MNLKLVPTNMATNPLSTLFAALTITATLLSLAAPCKAEALIRDPLNDWNMATGHTTGLVFLTDDPTIADMDTSRVALAENVTDGAFYYHLTGISSVSISVFYNAGIPSGSVRFYSSPDGNNWTQLAVTATPPVVQAEPTWRGQTMSAQIDPTTSNYLQVKIHSNHAGTPEIGQVELACHDSGGLPTLFSMPHVPVAQVTLGNHGAVQSATRVAQPSPTVHAISMAQEVNADPGLHAPAGFSVISAGGGAYLNWFPVKGAQSYNIKRRAVDKDETTSVATDAPFTYYVDSNVKPGEEYYYSVTANVRNNTTPNSDLVLASPKAGTDVLMDTFDDWGVAAAKTTNLDIIDGDGNVQWVKRTAASRQSIVYKMPGVTSFAFNIMSSGDMSDQVTVEASIDGISWTPVPLATMLPPIVVDNGWQEAVAINDGKVPANVSQLRVNLGKSTDTAFDSPLLSNMRITSGGSIEGAEAAIPVEHVIVDHLKDWSHVSAKSLDWGFDTKNAEMFNGIASRAMRTANADEFLTYSYPGITTFSAKVYSYLGQISTVTFWYSADNGASWTQVDVAKGTEVQARANWGYFNMKPTMSLPEGVTDLKIEFAAHSGSEWDTQLAEMSISYTGNVSANSGDGSSDTAPTPADTPTSAPTTTPSSQAPDSGPSTPTT